MGYMGILFGFCSSLSHLRKLGPASHVHGGLGLQWAWWRGFVGGVRLEVSVLGLRSDL